MSNPAEFSDGRRTGKSPEKSNFAQTCSRLSQYLKERGNLRNLGLEMAGKREPKATKNLLPNMEKPGEMATQHGYVDLFKDSPENTNKAAASGRKPAMIDLDPETAQMTIFYGGKVVVFDSVPAEKAKELMAMAGGGEGRLNSSESRPAAGPNPGPEQAQPQPKAIGSGVPIARRASLHRFMEKRKDRVTARAPYQVQGGPSASMSKDEEELALKL